MGRDYNFQFSYEHSAATSAKGNPAYRYVVLPDRIDLSTTGNNSYYAQAAVTIPAIGLPGVKASVSIPATRAAWGLTITKKSPNPENAMAFVNLVMGAVGTAAFNANGPAPSPRHWSAPATTRVFRGRYNRPSPPGQYCPITKVRRSTAGSSLGGLRRSDVICARHRDMKHHKTLDDGPLSQVSALSVMNRHRGFALLAIYSLALIATIGLAGIDTRAATAGVLRLATTTSTADTGLLDAILPSFEKACSCRVDVVAVGTGQALEIGRRGDADVVLVHARAAEDAFVAARDARERFDVMYNDYVIVGPTADPAKIAGLTRASDAFAAIARAQTPYASRGDQSGTHTKELAVWGALNLTPAGAGWYRSLGQGQGETLVFANELGAYAISDRGTWLSMRARLSNLCILVGGPGPEQNPDANLRNPYAVMAVNPDTHPGVNFPLATQFIEWLLAADTQRAIGAYGVERFGQPLFHPDSQPYSAARGVALSIGESTVPFGGILRT